MKKRIYSIILAALMVIVQIAALCTTVSAATSYSVKVSTGTYVEIKNLGSGKYLNVYGSKSASNTNITVYARDYTTGQKFRIASVGDGKYTFQPQCATSCRLNVYGNYSQNNSNVNTWTASGNPTQSWIIEYNSTLNGYVIRSADNPTYVLTATGSSNSSNVRLEKYSSSNKYQIWTSSAFAVTTTNTGASSNTSGTYNLCWPVSTSVSGYKWITSSLGARTAPVAGASVNHKGVDIGIPSNSNVLATADGVVKFVGYNSARGNYVVVYHASLGLTSIYQHLSSYSVKVGQNVTKGQVIAKSGNTGNSSGPHLHFELVLTSSAPTTVDCAWLSGAKLLDGHYDNKLISYEYRK